jgi:hypothetical protein
MDKHAKEDSGKATFVLVCIQSKKDALSYKTKHNLSSVVHVVAKPPAEYSLKYIPHHVVIGKDGIVKMNYDQPTRDYMSLL